MIKNYFKTAWRNLFKNKLYSLINVGGLAIGLTAGILILIWVQDELSFDSFHKKSGEIYRLENMVGTGSSRQLWTSTAAGIASLAKKNAPEVKDAVRVSRNYYYSLFKYGDKTFNEARSAYVDPSFFSVFDFALIKGNPGKPFTDNNSVILTETTAKKYFGDEEPIGKIILADNKINFTVTGLVKDFPKNSSIYYGMLFPMSLLNTNLNEGKNPPEDIDDNLGQFNYSTYLLLQPGVQIGKLENKLRDLHLKRKPEDTDINYLLQPLSKMHLYKSDGTNSGIEMVRIFTVIAILILMIACINYVNISTARSMLRSKEVSLRKIVGAARVQLFMQFIIETAVLFVFATFLSIVFMKFLLPLYNDISGKKLELDLASYSVWSVIGITATCTLLLSSIYPAMLLSSFEPLKVFKGKITAGIGNIAFRKILVIIQFTISIVLIIGTMIISKQMNYIRSKELGYDKDHVFTLTMREMRNHFEAVRTDLLKQPGIIDVTCGNSNIMDIGSQTGDTEWDGKEPGQTFMVRPMAIHESFIPFFKMSLKEGNNFTGAPADSLHFILNETAVKQAGIKDPIGKKFSMWDNEGTIIGVVKDFHLASMKRKIEPAVFYYKAAASLMYVKTSARDASKAIQGVQSQWKQYNADFPFDYQFMDETFNDLYKSEQRTGTLLNVFAFIAILISCLGLFGLATYTAQVRTREIGIRKTLGASVPGIIQLLATGFIKLVLVAIILAVPIGWYAMNKWLQDFAYRINIGWWVFAVAGVTALLIALVTISFKAIKAAIANPVKSLRTE